MKAGKILITGSTGFVGRHLTAYFVKQGYEVIGTYRNETENKVNGCRYIRIDLAEELLEEQHVDCVIHCAGQMHVVKTYNYVKNSILATRNILDFCESAKVKKIIFMSTISVYGECEGIVSEESAKTNLSDYALAKVLCENMVFQSELPHKYVLRLSRIVGKGGFESGGWLTKFAKQLIRGEEVQYSNGNMLYNNLFRIEDLEKACELLLVKCEQPELCIGTGAEQPMTVRDMVQVMRNSIGSQSDIIETEHSGKLVGHLVDISRLKEIGIEPQNVETTLRLMMKEAVERFG